MYEDPKEQEWLDDINNLERYLNSFFPNKKIKRVEPYGPHSGRCEVLFVDSELTGAWPVYVDSELGYTLFGMVPGVIVDALQAWDDDNFVVPF